MYTSSLKPFVINGTDISFLLSQVSFRPLFDANHNAVLNWDGTSSIFDGYGTLLYAAPVGQVATDPAAIAAVAQWGTSYQTVVDLSGVRDPAGNNNNLAGALWQYGAVDQIFPRLAAPNYTGYVTSGTTTSSAYAVTGGGTSHASDGTAITVNNIIDGSARAISLMTTTAGVHFAMDANGIVYDANGVATVTSWGNLATADEDPINGLGQVDTQARFIGSAGAASTGSATAGADPLGGDHFIGGLNPGVSPSNGFFVLFGQFFDHGLDFIGKGEQHKTIKITLDPTDPLYGMIGPDGQPTTSITISRANVATIDANGDAQYVDHTSPFIDQSQTYGSHAQLTSLLREWVQDPSDGQWKAGMSMFDGHTLQTEWKNAYGQMVNDTLPTLNELRAHVAATGRDVLTWEDVLDLRNRDASGHLTSGNSGSPLILDSNPRFDFNHLHGIHDYNNDNIITANEYSSDAAQRSSVDDAIAFLGTQVRPGDSFGMVGDMLTLVLGTDLPAGPSTIPAGTYTGASALMMWVNFSDFSIMAPPGMTIPDPSGNVHDAVSEILMASVGDHYIAGDGRVNENFGLTSIHHVFHEEHNFQVQNFMDALHRDDLSAGDPAHTNLHSFQIDTGNGMNAAGDYVNGLGEITWDLEKMFQSTKLIVEMEYQHAAVDQYARNVTPNIQEFVGYSPDKSPGVTLEYAQAAFRFGHSTLRETIDTIDPSHGLTGKIMGFALRSAFLNPDEYAKTGAAATLLGMTHQQMNDVDEFVTPALNQGLLGLPLDLAAINIARGRDLGIPTLNDFREAIGLARYTSWNDFGNNMQHPSSLVNFIAAYSFNEDPDGLAKAQAIIGLADGTILDGDVAAMGFTSEQAIQFLDNDATGTLANADGFNHIDTWLGGIAEVHQPGGLLGETFDLVFMTQIESLMDGDRFYYLYRLAGQQFAEEVGNGQLKDIVERNTGLTHLNGNIFGYADKYYDFGAQREVFSATAGGAAETQTTSNNHKYGDLIDQNGALLSLTDPTNLQLNKMGAHNGVGALTWNNTLANATLANNFENNGAGVGIYTNSGRSTALDGQIIKSGGMAYVRDTRMADTGQDTGAANLNGGTNLDGTPNSGADSNEVIVGTQYGDMIYAQGGDDTVYGEDGNDIIYGGYGIDRLYGGGGSDRIYGGDNPDLMDGGAGDDFLYGESSGSDINGNDQVIGGAGNDFISGGVGIDKLSGGTGDDHIMGDGDTDPFTHGSDGNDIVEGNSGGDILYGDNGDDLLIGGADQDQMFGGKGDDIIRPGDSTGALTIGTDEVLGGDGVTDEGTLPGTIGFDIIDFSDNTVRPGGVFFDIGEQINPNVAVNGIPTQVPSFQIEGVVGSGGGDTLIGDNNAESGLAGWVIGANGDDTLQGGTSNDIIIGGSMRLDDVIGKYNSGYTHNNNNAGVTEAEQNQDALYQGASHRVLYNEVIDGSGLIDAINTQTGGADFDKHFTEMLRSDQMKNMVLGSSTSDGVASLTGGNDTVVFQGNKADYTVELITYTDHSGHAHQGLRVTDSVAGRDGSDAVIDVANFRFANGTFTFDQMMPPPAASVGNATVTEGNLGTVNANFTITLSHAAATDVTVNYSTANGTAVAPGDFASTSGSVTIPAGQLTAVVSVAVAGDTTFETNETFNLNLTSANNGVTIANGTGVGTIINDDTQPTLSIVGGQVTEGDAGTKVITFTVSQSAVSGTDTAVHWATADGTALGGSDFAAAAGDLSIAAGQTSATFTVTVNGDTAIEANEAFTVALSAPVNATIATGTATGTIINDDLNIVYNAARQSGTVFPGGGLTPAIATVTSNPGTNAMAVTGWTNPVGDSASYTMAGSTLNRSAAFADNSTYTVNLSATTTTGGVETKTVTIKTGSDTLLPQTLTGVAGSDTVIYGKGGIDLISGSTGNDWIDGGAGNDIVTMAGSRYNYSWDLTAGLAAGTNDFPILTDLVGNQGSDTLVSVESLVFADGTYGFNNAGNANQNVVLGTSTGNSLNGRGGNDIVAAGAGNDTITYDVDNPNILNVMTANSGGRDMIFGGAGIDTFVLNGNASTENFYIYSRDAFLAANPGAIIGAATGIVVTRNGTAATNIIAELNSIEEIKVNTTGLQNATNLNGTGLNVNGTGGVSGDQIHVIGDFTNTGLAYNTITVNGGTGSDVVDITGLTSAHRVVFNTGGGTDTVTGDLRPQDVINGALGGTGHVDALGYQSGYASAALVQPEQLASAQGGVQSFESIAPALVADSSAVDGPGHAMELYRASRMGEHGLLDHTNVFLDNSHHFLA